MNAAPAWDRFAIWPRGRAVVALLAFLAMLAAAAWAPQTVGNGKGGVIVAKPPSVMLAKNAVGTRPRDDDLRLYDAVIARVRNGENYYRVVVAEHRQAHYPVRPGLAVRLPTLAYLDGWMGVAGDAPAPVATAISLVLMLATILAWWRRLRAEPAGEKQRLYAIALLAIGASLGTFRYFFVLHELWAGMLVALAFALHRPRQNKWVAAWCVAALALAIRELTLPFVLLLAANAVYRKAWAEAAAWAALIALFGVGLAIHLHLVAAQVLPGDVHGPSWLALRGLSGWLANVVLSSNLRFLPHWLSGPLVVCAMLGWAGWKSEAGAFGALLYLGYGLAFTIAGRVDNYYWGFMVGPAMLVGLAFAPMAAMSLVKAALPDARNALRP